MHTVAEMARRPADQKAPAPPISAAQPQSAGETRPSIITDDEAKSPLFRSLREIDAIEDPDQRRYAALDRLDRISELALGRERTIKNGEVVKDPDCNAAVKVEEVSHRLLGIEAKRGVGKFDPGIFGLAAVKEAS